MTRQPPIRPIEAADFHLVAPVIDEWWGGRPMRSALHTVFFEHFTTTSFAVGLPGEVQAFLLGFQSPAQPNVGYIHFVGIDPSQRGCGLGRLLYEHFFSTLRALGCDQAQCITSPANSGSISFHQAMGFEILPGSGQVNGVPVILNHAGDGLHHVFFRKFL
jgi:predicted GNAT superfamily acetyltransferase